MALKNIYRLSVSGFIIGTLFTSCSIDKKVTALKNQTIIKDQQQKSMLEKMDSLTGLNKQKLAESETNANSSQQVQQYLDSIQQNIKNDISNDSVFLSNTTVRRKQLKLMQKEIEESETNQVLAINDVALLTDFLNTTTFTRLNMAAFFETGDYKVSADKLPGAKAYFAPVLDDIQKFIAKYKSRKLVITIVSVGYADEQPISDNDGTLYKTLTANMPDVTNPTRQQLNTELSSLRAFTISNLLKDINSTPESKEKLNYNHDTYLAQGRGEMLPSNKIKDYTPNDERRRIVVIYWGILPAR